MIILEVVKYTNVLLDIIFKMGDDLTPLPNIQQYETFINEVLRNKLK